MSSPMGRPDRACPVEIFRGAFSPVNVFNRGISIFSRQLTRRWIAAVPYPLQFTIQAQTEEAA